MKISSVDRIASLHVDVNLPELGSGQSNDSAATAAMKVVLAYEAKHTNSRKGDPLGLSRHKPFRVPPAVVAIGGGDLSKHHLFFIPPEHDPHRDLPGPTVFLVP